jgi:hypothetical protein
MSDVSDSRDRDRVGAQAEPDCDVRAPEDVGADAREDPSPA